MASLSSTSISGNLVVSGDLQVAGKTAITGDIEFSYVELMNQIYPVGTIYMSASSTNPGTLFGGTWVAWGSGRVPIGVNSSDTDFNSVEKTGGSKTINLSHTHTGPSHTHTGPSHTHTGPSHTHTANHNHTLNSGYAMIETTGVYIQYVEKTSTPFTPTWSVAGSSSSAPPSGSESATQLGGTTDTATVTTSASGTGSTGAGGTGETSASGTGNTGSAGSSSQTIVQPYITCYMWKRTA
jgi:hypothetical protein